MNCDIVTQVKRDKNLVSIRATRVLTVVNYPSIAEATLVGSCSSRRVFLPWSILHSLWAWDRLRSRSSTLTQENNLHSMTLYSRMERDLKLIKFLYVHCTSTDFFEHTLPLTESSIAIRGVWHAQLEGSQCTRLHFFASC